MNQFIPYQSSCILKQNVRWSWISESSSLVLNHEMPLGWALTVSRNTGNWSHTSEKFDQLVKSQIRSDYGNDQSREEREIISDTGGWSCLLLSDRRGIKSNWYNNRSRDKTSVWMTDRRVIEPTLHWSPNFSIERMIRVDPWIPYHFLGKCFPEQSCYVEMMEHHWKTFLVIKLDSPCSEKIRVLEPYLGTCNFVVKSCRNVCLTSQSPHEGYFSGNITSWRIN